MYTASTLKTESSFDLELLDLYLHANQNFWRYTYPWQYDNYMPSIHPKNITFILIQSGKDKLTCDVADCWTTVK